MDFVFLTAYGLFSQFGAPIVFVAALIEATVGLGMVFPGQQIIALGGAASAKGDGDVVAMLVYATVGTILGDVISYIIGRRWSETLYSSRFGLHLRVAAAMMSGRARWLMPFYHFYSVTRSVGPAAAGALRIPLAVWLPLDVFGAVFFNAVWVVGGYAFGALLLQENGALKESPAIRLGLAASALIWFFVLRHLFDRRMRETRAAEERSQQAAAAALALPEHPSPDNELAPPERGQHDSMPSR